MDSAVEVVGEVAIRREVEAQLPVVTQEMERLEARALSPMTAELAADLRQRCDSAMKVVDEKLAPIIEKAFQTHRSLTALRNEMKSPYVQAKQTATRILGNWQKKLADEAAAERERQEEEARRQAEEQKRIEAERLAAEAAAKADEGDQAGAEMLIEEAAKVEAQPIVPAYVPPAPVEKRVGNTSTSFTPKGKVKDVHALLRWIVAHPMSMTIRVDDEKGIWIPQSEINRITKAGVKLDGVEVYQEAITRKVGR